MAIYKIVPHVGFESANGLRGFCSWMQVWPTSGGSDGRYVCM